MHSSPPGEQSLSDSQPAKRQLFRSMQTSPDPRCRTPQDEKDSGTQRELLQEASQGLSQELLLQAATGVVVVLVLGVGVTVEGGGVAALVGVGPHPFSALFTPLMSCAMSTWPCEFWNARQALANWPPSAMFTPRMRSLILTMPVLPQSPTQVDCPRAGRERSSNIPPTTSERSACDRRIWRQEHSAGGMWGQSLKRMRADSPDKLECG
jgi:hypothetical protein